MQWEQMTAPEFARAVEKTGVCILPMGVLERHSEHLPLGQDMLASHAIACRAAEKEPAVVYPPWYFGQIYEARAFPGCVTLRPTLLLELLESVLDEIGRNGFRKVLLLNGHGGNRFMIFFMAQCALWARKPYSIYVPDARLTPERQKQWDGILETKEHGHACECETSVALHLFPELVKMNAMAKQPAEALMRMKKAPGLFAGISWYADYPDHYAGDARCATAEKGRKLFQLRVDNLAEQIALVKADKVVPALEAEFHKLADDPCAKRGKR